MILGKKCISRSQASPVYILSSQTLVVDALLVLAHLIYHAPAVALQVRVDALHVSKLSLARYHPDRAWIHLRIRAYVRLVSQLAQPHSDCAQQVEVLHNFIALFCVSRLVVIVFKRTDVFTRKRTIALSILHHLVASALSIATEFMLPCCKWVLGQVTRSIQ